MGKFNSNSIEIRNHVENMAKTGRIKSFYTESINRKLKIPIDVAVIELAKLCDEGILQLKYELRCVEDLNTIEVVESYKELLGTQIECEDCGEIIVGYENIYPIYYITDEYREFVKKNQV